MHPYLKHASFRPPESTSKRHLDQFIHFCRAQTVTDRETGTQTTLLRT